MKHVFRADAHPLKHYSLTDNNFKNKVHHLGGHRRWLSALLLFVTLFGYQSAFSQTAVIGSGTEIPSSTIYGPIYRFSATSSTSGARANMLWTAAEMAAAGVPAGAMITSVEFNKTNAANFNGTVPFQMLVANSGKTTLSTSLTWADVQASHTSVINNAAYNLPLAAGWVPFVFNTPFNYTGGAFEVATEYSISGLTSPHSTDAFKWEYTTGTSDKIVAGVTATAATLSATTTGYKHRPNVRINYIPASACTAPPTPGTATASVSNICAGLNFNLNLTGYSIGSGQTYQWETSANGTTGWTAIGTPGSTPLLATSQPAGTNYYRAAVTCSGQTAYSTVVSVTSPAQPSGIFTINKNAPAGGGNFQSFADAVNFMNCGIGGSITFNVVAGSGPYTEQVDIPQILGASAANTITFNGNGETIQADPVSATRAIFKLNGADFVTINNFNITATGTTSSSFGWGVHFTNVADNNVISNNTITIGSTSTTESNSAGIVFSNSATSVTSTGDNGSNNLITGNTIRGGYKSIQVSGSSSVPSNNRIVNNTLQAFYYSAVSLATANAVTIEGNSISRPTRTDLASTSYIIHISGNTLSSVINKNRIFETNTGTGSGTVYVIYFTSNDAPTGFENVVKNNLVYNLNTSGTIYVFYNSNSDGTQFYNNSVSLVRPSTATGLARVFYQTSDATGIDIRNNVIYVSDEGSGAKHVFYYNASNSTITSNNNVVYATPSTTNFNVGYFGASFATLNDWQTANSGIYDQNSVAVNPLYANAAAGDLTPSNLLINNIGVPLAAVPFDFTGAARHATTPDPGAFEFTPSANDAGVTAINSPGSPVVPNVSLPVSVTIRNFAAANLSNTTIAWSVNGVLQAPYAWTGNLASLQTSNPVAIGNFTFPAGDHTLKVWTEMPNGIADGTTTNDTTTITVVSCAPATGIYTINAALPTGGTNFASFTDAFNQLGRCGITSDIVLNVERNSGPYNEQFEIPFIPGTNNFSVTVNGRGNTISYLTTAANLAVIRLNGTNNLTLDSLNIVVDNAATTGWGIHLYNNTLGNTISNSTISIPTNSTANTFAGIVASGSTTSLTAGGATTNSTVIMNNTITGGYYGIRLNGSPAVGNQIVGNKVEGFYYYGIYASATDGIRILNNEVTRPNRTSTSFFYGIYVAGVQNNSIVAYNKIHNPFGGNLSSTSDAIGIYTTADASAGTENYFFNNLIYNFNGAGDHIGIYNSGGEGAYYYFNTIALRDQNSTSTLTTKGFYQTVAANNIQFKNNVIAVTRNATGAKTGIYLNTATSMVTTSNNVIYVNAPNGSNNIGYVNGALVPTLAAWQSAGFGTQSVDVDPMFVNPAIGNFQPSNPAVDNIGTPIALVSDDIRGNSRNATTPDPGAYEFSVVGLDAAITWASPTLVPSAGNTPIQVEIASVRSTPITSLSLSYTDGSNVVTETFTGLNLTLGNTQVLTFTQPYNFTGATQLRAYINTVNTVGDDDRLNDTTAVQNLCVSLSGMYTINKNQPASATNYQSFADAVSALQNCGISGPVTFTVVQGSGPYNEQLVFNNTIPISGLSAANNITIKGNYEVLSHDATASTTSRGTVMLSGMQHLTIDSLTINATNTTYGYGVHMTQGSNAITLSNNRINVASTSTTEASSAGIVAAGSVTSTTSTGNNAFNLNILNNTITGGYLGIRLNGASATPTAGNNITGNRVRDFYSDGIYVYYADSSVIDKNDISRPARTTSMTTFYGIQVDNSKAITVSSNRIHNPSGVNTGSHSFYGIYNSGDAPQGKEVKVINNLIYNVNAKSTVYGIYNTGADGVQYYHNTIVLDNPSMVSSSTARAFYQLTAATGIEIKNNIFSITRGGTGAKHALYFGTSTSTIVSNKNVFHVNAPAAHVGYYSGNKTTLADWQTANGSIYDQNSVEQNPLFVSAATGNFEPQNPLVNNIGDAVGVMSDINGNPRSATTPDPGAYEFEVLGRDVAISWVAPVAPIVAGNQNITVRVTNILTAVIDSVRLTYTDGAVSQTQTFTGLNLGNLQSADLTFAVPYNVSGSGTLRAFISTVNGLPDDNQANDTVSQGFCLSYAGVYTINSTQATAGTNFRSFTDAFNALNSCGVSAPVTLNVAAGSGPYNEQVTLMQVPGASAANRVTINGRNNTITFASTATDRHVIRLNGASYVTIDSLIVEAAGTTYGWGIHLMNNANYNEITNSTIRMNSTSTTVANSAGILANSGTDVLNTTGSNANYLRVENTTITGGSTAIRMYGETGAANATGNQFINNTLTDFYQYGIYLGNTDSTVVRGNNINRLTRTGSLGAFYGVYLASDTKRSIIEKNRFHHTHTANTASTAVAYGIYSSSNDAPVGGENIVRNNLFYEFDGAGAIYAFYNSGSDGIHYLNNTISFEGTNAGAVVRGFYQSSAAANLSFYNNIVRVNKGSGVNTAIYLNTAGTMINTNNNVFSLGTNGNVGYANGAAVQTLAAWRTANPSFDQNSVAANPLFANAAAGDFTPTNPTIDNIGRVLARVTDDFFGNARSTTTPDAGAIEFTVIVGLDKSLAKTTAISAWPNPFTNNVHLQIETEKAGVATIRLTDALGRVVMTQKQIVTNGTNPLQLTVSENLPTGMYLLQVELNGTVTVQKMIKQ